MKDVSIVILNYNGKDKLRIILESIKNIKIPLDYEVIVIDNASDDCSPEFIEKNYSFVKVIKNKTNEGYSAFNHAKSIARGKYILILNNDMKLTRGCIENMFKIAEKDKSIALVCPKMIDFFNKKLSSYGTFISRSFYTGYITDSALDFEKEIPYVGVGLFRKKAIIKVGYLFDPLYFLYAEDVDLGLRLRLQGYKIIYSPESVIYHMHPLDPKKISVNPKTIFLMERNLLITFIKCMSLKTILMYIPYVLFMRIAAIFKDVFRLKFLNAFARIKAILWLLFHINTIIEKRRYVQTRRKSPDSFLLRLFTEKYLFKKKI